MKLTAIISLLAIMLLGSTATALAQEKSCSFDLVGTWKAQLSPTEAILYRLDSKGAVTVLSVSDKGEPQQIATAKYEVINELGKPGSVSFTASGKNRIFGAVRKTMSLVSYDDTSITCLIPGIGTTRWTRVDPDRYFIVLAARRGEFYDATGSAFPMVIKLAGGVPTIDAFGVYLAKDGRNFGTVPPDVYRNYLREARNESETTLRLEINSRQYVRALKIIKEWERRAREGALLYTTAAETLDDPTSLNNILVVKAVTETLNQCSADFNLYPLNYVVKDDWISNKVSSAFVPFYYFKELRQRNEARHIDDKKFQELVHLPNLASR
ncbi:MAG TPA: hypothetical protein VGQ41_25235 [Pyrinomonadaceae bacterium]|jgi:hypothetical protein|nr:hypothetical protein [Pyrinomonadaceae bacterium]